MFASRNWEQGLLNFLGRPPQFAQNLRELAIQISAVFEHIPALIRHFLLQKFNKRHHCLLASMKSQQFCCNLTWWRLASLWRNSWKYLNSKSVQQDGHSNVIICASLQNKVHWAVTVTWYVEVRADVMVSWCDTRLFRRVDLKHSKWLLARTTRRRVALVYDF